LTAYGARADVVNEHGSITGSPSVAGAFGAKVIVAVAIVEHNFIVICFTAGHNVESRITTSLSVNSAVADIITEIHLGHALIL